MDRHVVRVWAKLNALGGRRQKTGKVGRSGRKVKTFGVLGRKGRIVGIILAKAKMFGITLVKAEGFAIIRREMDIWGKAGGRSRFFWHKRGKI